MGYARAQPRAVDHGLLQLAVDQGLRLCYAGDLRSLATPNEALRS